MRMAKFSRASAAFVAAAMLATACSSDDPETPDETTTDSEDPGALPGEGYDWSDVRRRQAVSMAIDRQAITDVIFNGARVPADDWWPQVFAGYRGGCESLSYNPEMAKQLWDEAGGNAGPITFWFNSGSGHEEWIEAIANQLQQNLGVEEVAFEGAEFADYLDKLDAAEVDGPFRLGWGMDYPSPGNFLAVLHGTEGGFNRTGYSNPAFDEAAAAGDALPLEEAIPFYQQAADILCEDVPFSPIFFTSLNAVWSEGVDNVEFDAFQRLNLQKVTDTDGDGEISVYVCEPQARLTGVDNNDSCGNEVLNALFTGLVELDKESGELVNAVASSIETTDDGTTWEITLEEGWTFHDGTPVTAQDFVNAWNYGSFAPNASKNSYYYGIPSFGGYGDLQCGSREATQEDVDAEAATEVGEEIVDCETNPPPSTELSGLVVNDDLSFTVTLDAPFAQFPLLLLHGSFYPLPQSFFDAEDKTAWGDDPIGNGPFQMAEPWIHDVAINTTAYDAYAGTKPSFDTLTFTIYSEDTTGYNDLRAGNLDIMDTVPTAELGTYRDEFAGRFIEEGTGAFNYLGFPIDLDLVAEWAN